MTVNVLGIAGMFCNLVVCVLVGGITLYLFIF